MGEFLAKLNAAGVDDVLTKLSAKGVVGLLSIVVGLILIAMAIVLARGGKICGQRIRPASPTGEPDGWLTPKNLTFLGFVTLIVGFLLMWWSVVDNRSQEDDPHPPTVSIQRVESIDGGQGISITDGFRASGTAVGVDPGETLWLMDRDDAGYTIDQMAVLTDDTWSAESFPVGDEGVPLPTTLVATLVVANETCAQTLQQMMREGVWQMVSLPPGCEVVATSLVHIVRP